MSAQPPFFGPIDLRAVQVDLQRLVDLLDVKGRGSGFDLSTAIVPVVDVGQLLEFSQQRPGALSPLASPFEVPFPQAPQAGTPELPPHARGFLWFTSAGFSDAADVTDSLSDFGPLTNAVPFAPERALVRVAAVQAQVSFSAGGQEALVEVIGGTIAATTIHSVFPQFQLAPPFAIPPAAPLVTAFAQFNPPQRVIPNGGSWPVGPSGFLRLRRSVRGATGVAVITTVVQVLAQISPAVD